MLGGNTGDTTCRSEGALPAAPTTLLGLRQLLATYFVSDSDVEAILRPYLNERASTLSLSLSSSSSSSPSLTHSSSSSSFRTSSTSSTDYQELYYEMSRDAGVLCPTLWLARRMARRMADETGKKGETFLYEFGYNATGGKTSVVNHGGELNYVFQNFTRGTTRSARQVGRVVSEYWSSFVHAGVPMSSLGGARWHAFGGRESTAVDTEEEEDFLLFASSGSVMSTPYSYDAHGKCSSYERYMRRGEEEEKRLDAFGYLC